jgi:hypothetical protein
LKAIQMKENSDIQQKIIDTVTAYKQFYLEDYLAVVKEVKNKRDDLKNKFGDMSKTTDVLERPLNELPSTLFFLLGKALSEDEMKYWYTTKGLYWFGRQFPEFRVTKSI